MPRFKSIAWPDESKGVSIKSKKLVVPNQSMSLQEILDRFTRNEALPIGKEVTYYEEGDDDLEKLAHMDLVDRAEYIEALKETKRRFEQQQKDKKAKIEADILAKIEAEQREKVAKKEADSAEPAK